jgi:glucose/arabinose dehydrogenase
LRPLPFFPVRRTGLILAVIAAMLALPTVASGAALVQLAPNDSWGSSPIHGASPPGDPRLFVVERGGGVRVVENGALRPAPFLTVPNVDTIGERGLLSIAFAPDYAASGLFYVFAVAKGPDAFGGAAGDLRLIEYRRSTADPNLADPGSARLVFALAHGAPTHNGGQIAFGPDGLLYLTVGDNANSANAQDFTNLYGKVLRIDPRQQPGGAPYGLPASNPFAAAPPARPEIYALGLRNPFRASFSPGGDLIVADVGQSTWEEVNVGRATGTPAATTLAGANLGWPICEGACATPGLLNPFFQYDNGETPRQTTGCAVLGGYVVRDRSLTGLTGRYLYADACREDLRSLDLAVPGADPQPTGVVLPGGNEPLGLGEDGRGCVYVMATGTAFRVAPGAGAAAACPEAAVTGAADTTPPRLSLSGSHRQPPRRSLRVFAICDESCSLLASAKPRFSGAKASAKGPPVSRRSAAAGQRVRLTVELRRKALRRAKQVLAHGGKVVVSARVTATDASGNGSQKVFRIRLRTPRP